MSWLDPMPYTASLFTLLIDVHENIERMSCKKNATICVMKSFKKIVEAIQFICSFFGTLERLGGGGEEKNELLVDSLGCPPMTSHPVIQNRLRLF